MFNYDDNRINLTTTTYNLLLMWVSKHTEWHENHTDLTKYFFEKIKQEVDYEEIISNKHRTTNGLTIIKEIIETCILTLKRRKSYRRLVSLIEEANEPLIKSNIINDFVLTSFHSDIQKYYKELVIKDVDSNINDLLLNSKIHFYRIEKSYLKNIEFLIRGLDFSSDKFEREAKKIDLIIKALVPYLLFKGYSPTSISDISYRMIAKDTGADSPLRFVDLFGGKKHDFDFLIITYDNRSEFETFIEFLDSKDISFLKLTATDLKLLKPKFHVKLKSNEVAYQIKHRYLDPHNFIRNLYEQSIRNYILSDSRASLSFYNDFFDKVYWKFSKADTPFYPSNIKIDPINVKKRTKTLQSTLRRVSEFDNRVTYDGNLPIIPEIQDSVYYYNLAIGSKSIENSLLLLWSSLESLVPYRFKNTDIENVQYFVSKALSIGSIGRPISSFAHRLMETNNHIQVDFKKLRINPEISLIPDKFSYWAFWISNGTTGEDDPYHVLKPLSNLLCRQYLALNQMLSKEGKNFKVSELSQKILASKKSIEYQLDRIYLHRNQIVHSGKFINEYNNLWLHLEWYIGKLLAYCFIKYYEKPEQFNKEKIFMELEGDYNMLMNLLDNHKDKEVNEIQFAFGTILRHTWQMF